MNVQIGMKGKRRPMAIHLDPGDTQRREMVGTVVYIHPKGRFHIVEFAARGGVMREAFPGVRVDGSREEVNADRRRLGMHYGLRELLG